MPVLFFSTVNDCASQGLEALVQATVWPDQLEICCSVKALYQRLRRPRGNLRIAVFNVSSEKELRIIVSLKDLLDDLETILILPDVTMRNAVKAHEIRPRFLVHATSDWKHSDR